MRIPIYCDGKCIGETLEYVEVEGHKPDALFLEKRDGKPDALTYDPKEPKNVDALRLRRREIFGHLVNKLEAAVGGEFQISAGFEDYDRVTWIKNGQCKILRTRLFVIEGIVKKPTEEIAVEINRLFHPKEIIHRV